MDEEIRAEIAAFTKERDEMLMSLDVDQMIAFHEKHNPSIGAPSNREVCLISMHKARTAAKSLPKDARRLSRDWLHSRGFTSLDDGDLDQPS
jgi:hypothetical protein